MECNLENDAQHARGEAVSRTTTGIERFDALMARQDAVVMGILNVTPDSFFDGGRDGAISESIERGLRMADEGADIIDVGGESTRPPGHDYGIGAMRISEEEEIARVSSVVRELARQRPDVMISIDTMKPEVARHSLKRGAAMINDVSAGSYDDTIWTVAATGNVPYVLMHGHKHGDVRRIDQITYANVVHQVYTFLEERIGMSGNAGVRRIVADVGLGFAKGLEENLALLRSYDRFGALGVPTLLGASRKSFIGRITGGVPPSERLEGSLAVVGHAWSRGAKIFRVHDVAPTVRFLAALAAL